MADDGGAGKAALLFGLVTLIPGKSEPLWEEVGGLEYNIVAICWTEIKKAHILYRVLARMFHPGTR